MREVNNNTTTSSNVNFQGVTPAAKEEVKAPEVQAKEVTDLGKMPAEVIGRSQVSQTGLEKDLAFFMADKDVVDLSMKYFDQMEKLGYTSEDAAALMCKFAEEFSTKKSS